MDPEPRWEFGPLAQANFGISWAGYFTLVNLGETEWISIITVLILQSLWQIAMGFIPGTVTVGWTVNYMFGKDGFNYPRYVYGIIGLMMAFIIDLIDWPHTRPLGGYAKDPCGRYLDLSDEAYADCI